MTPVGNPQPSAREGAVFGEERRRVITDLVRAQGRAEAATLSELLGVNPETVRRDLQVLQDQGLVHRVHGGAVATDKLAVELRVAHRGGLMREEKQRIAKLALTELPATGAIFIEAGSTAQLFADALPHDADLTVITNALPLALRLADRTRHPVLTVGGRVRPESYAEVDAWALERLAALRVDVAFVGTNGIDLAWGLSTPDPAEAAVKAAILAAARRSVLLADHSKFGQSFLCRYADVADVDVLVTDTGLTGDDERALRERDVEVRRA